MLDEGKEARNVTYNRPGAFYLNQNAHQIFKITSISSSVDEYKTVMQDGI